MILRDSSFITQIERNLNFRLPSTIREIGIDYTTARELSVLLEKLDKTYQTRDRFLIIVLTGPGDCASLIKQFNKVLNAQIGYPWTQHVRIMAQDEFFFNNMGLKSGSKLAVLYNKYNKAINECFTSHYSQEKLDTLWRINAIVKDYFKGLGRQLSLSDFMAMV